MKLLDLRVYSIDDDLAEIIRKEKIQAILVSPSRVMDFRNNQKMLSVADDFLFIPEVDPVFSAVVEIIPLQLLAYYVAKENGCDIDKPKNLAKSVTVE